MAAREEVWKGGITRIVEEWSEWHNLEGGSRSFVLEGTSEGRRSRYPSALKRWAIVRYGNNGGKRRAV
jgi:hypothetical protein